MPPLGTNPVDAIGLPLPGSFTWGACTAGADAEWFVGEVDAVYGPARTLCLCLRETRGGPARSNMTGHNYMDVHHTFLCKVHRRWSGADPGRGRRSYAPFLDKIVRNACIDVLRRSARRPEVQIDESFDVAEEERDPELVEFEAELVEFGILLRAGEAAANLWTPDENSLVWIEGVLDKAPPAELQALLAARCGSHRSETAITKQKSRLIELFRTRYPHHGTS